MAKEFRLNKATDSNIIAWLYLKIGDMHSNNVNIKGKDLVKKDKMAELRIALDGLDVEMVAEKIYRRLKGLDYDDKPTPTFIKDIIRILCEYTKMSIHIPDDDIEEEEDDDEEE